MTDAFRCDGCDEHFHPRQLLLDLDLNTTAVDYSDITFDDIEAAYDIVWDGAQGDLCVDCGQEALGALVDLFADGASEGDPVDGTAEATGGVSDMETTPVDEATDADIEAAVDGHYELPEFDELVDESEDEDEDDDLQKDEEEESDDGQEAVYGSGLSPTAERVLSVLREHGELTSGEIQAKADRAQGTISRTLSELKEKDRVESRKDPDDGRRQLHSLPDDAGQDEHRVGDPIDEDGPGGQDAEADGGATTETEGDALPPGVCPQDIRDAVDAVREQQTSAKPYLGDVADELNVREARARLFCHEAGVYSDVIDASGYRGGA